MVFLQRPTFKNFFSKNPMYDSSWKKLKGFKGIHLTVTFLFFIVTYVLHVY